MVALASAEIRTKAAVAVYRFRAAEQSGSPGPEAEKQLREAAAQAVTVLEGSQDFTWYIRNRLYTLRSGELSVQYYGRGPADGTWKLQDIVQNTTLRVKVVRNFLRDFPTMLISRHDRRIARAIEVLEKGGQRQDSLSDQMADVLELARAAGCYDALDLIQRLREQA